MEETRERLGLRRAYPPRLDRVPFHGLEYISIKVDIIPRVRNDPIWVALLAVLGLCCVAPLVLLTIVAVGPGVLAMFVAGPAAGVAVALTVLLAARFLMRAHGGTQRRRAPEVRRER